MKNIKVDFFSESKKWSRRIPKIKNITKKTNLVVKNTIENTTKITRSKTMDVDRHEYQGGVGVAREQIKYVLDTFEKYDDEKVEDVYHRKVIPNCSVEEMVGALVSAEQVLKMYFERD